MRPSGCLGVTAAAIVALALGGCASERTSAPTASALAPAPFASSELVGRWGVGAYHRDADLARTEREARAQCRNPYVISAGQNGGVMMHLADEKEPFELRVRGGANGRVILGPDNAPDEYNDREILGYDGNSFRTRWLDSEIASRYGTTVYVRCGGAAAPRRS